MSSTPPRVALCDALGPNISQNLWVLATISPVRKHMCMDGLPVLIAMSRCDLWNVLHRMFPFLDCPFNTH